ncbi:hypothetical protein [Natranaerofaba carboxydovora]|uniref:hypothetical protein n=1 Tax=Natranaerofaba carboxydovora TaxID=2742683 RepID=UPI001F142EFE|nr:hypothetical protein [Natranaerofaba carboxydovora]
MKVNIKNAFDVVLKTYENIDKLMRYCDICAYECSYIPSTESHFLRYKSDPDYNGWLITSFIKLYQSTEDEELENYWQDGPIYGMNIYLLSEPSIYLAKYEFEDMSAWEHGYFSNRDFWFASPLRPDEYGNEFEIEILQNENLYFVSTPHNDKKHKYLDMKRAVFTYIDMLQVTSENVEELIFNEFDKLKDL